MTRAKVLVVEDDKVFARFTQGSLIDFGYTVIKIVATGEEAIQKTGELKPDIVLMDISLPGAMDGIEAAKEIYNRYDTPVVYLTAAVNDSLFQQENSNNHFGYLVKPFEKNQLYVEIETALHKHKAQQKSRKTQEWLSIALKGITDAVIATDTGGLVNMMNPSAEKLTGWNLQEAIFQPLAKVLKVCQNSEKLGGDQLSLETKAEELFHAEIELATQAGNIPLECNANKLYDDQGKMIGTIYVLRDIRERKRAEKALKESEEKLRALLNAPTDAMALIDPKGIILSANKIFAEKLSKNVDAIIGKCFYELFPSDLAKFRKAKIEKVYNTAKPARFVDESVDGRIFNIQYYPVCSAEGNVTEIAVYARDITELLIAEEENTQLGRIVDESLNEIYIFDAKTFRYLRVNLGARTNLGYTMEELYEMTPLDLKPEYTLRSFKKLVRPLLKGEKDRLHFSTKHRRKDGTLYPVEVHLQLTSFKSSQVFVAFILDISERERAEEQIRELTQAVEQSPASIVVTDIDGNIEYVNRKFEKVTGYSLHEAIGGNPRILNSGEQSEEFYKDLWATILSGNEWHGQFHNKKKNGQLYWEQASISPIKSKDGRITHFVTVKEDITQQKEIESALAQERSLMRAFMDYIPDAIYFKDSESRFIRVNKAQAKRLGLKDPQEAIGKSDFDFFSEKDARTTFNNEKKVRESGTVSSIERKKIFKDGRETWVLSTQVPLINEDGEIIGVFGFSKDITDRKRAENALKEQEELLRATLEATGDGILVVNKKWQVTHANARFAEMWRIPEEIMRTRDDHKLLHHILDQVVDPQNFIKRVKKQYHKSEQAFDTIYFKDGRIFERFSCPLVIDKKNVGRVWSFRDVTEHAQSEKALKDSEALYQSLIENLPLNAFRKDLQGRLVFANTRFCETLERPLDEMIGKSDFNFYPEELAAKYRKDDKKVIESGQILDEVEKHQTPDGNRLFVHVIKSPVKDSNGRIIGLQGIFWDVTEQEQAEEALRESQEKFKSISESAQDAIIMMNTDGEVSFWNKAAEKIFGYNREEVMGKYLHALITPARYREVQEKSFAAFRKTGQDAATGKTVELTGLRKDGSEFPLDLSLSHIQLKGNWQTVGIIRDISERKILEGQLLQSQKLESIGQLAAGIAHEINTPTQYIGDNTNFLKDSFADVSKLLTKYQALLKAAKNGGVSDEMIEEIEEIQEDADLEYLLEEIPTSINQTLDGIKRVSKIVRAMKDFSHPGVDGKTAIDLNRAIESTVTVARNEWKYVADVEINFDNQLPLVSCVPDQINQVVLNIIINAVHAISDVVGKHTDSKGKITVSTKMDGDYAEIRIGDNGAGIPEHARAKIFDPFFTTKEVGKGTGQGLAIAHDIVVGKHGGNISFETETGKGTTFIIRLPIIDKQAL
ncbi:MAG: PAS domain S-box protein [Calditrichaeota bacterium]|nr:PAS domain S-box protein [Calditrichota bacterium]